MVVSRVRQEEHTADALTEMKSQQGDMDLRCIFVKWVVFLSFPYVKAKFFQMIFHKQTLQIVSILNARGFEYLTSEIHVSLPVQRSSKAACSTKKTLHLAIFLQSTSLIVTPTKPAHGEVCMLF